MRWKRFWNSPAPEFELSLNSRKLDRLRSLASTFLSAGAFGVARLVLAAGVLLGSAWAHAQDGYLQRDSVKRFIQEMEDKHGYERAALEKLFSQVRHRDDIIARISRPAERVWTWGRYRSHLVDDRRIAGGIAFGRAHKATLERAHQTYGVAPEVVLAILGIETRYGEVTGSFPVFESLVTLGFDYPPRADFFRSELAEFLQLAREENKDPMTLKGSYAGAMGYGQFISSSYRHYAVDFDDDGTRDIWGNPVDAIGSIANYFHRHRWRGEHPPAVAVQVPENIRYEFDRGLKLDSSVGALRQLGVVFPADASALPADLVAKLYRLELQDGSYEYWVALHDFYVITRYNRSHLYAMAVHQLAQAIRLGLASEAAR